MRLLGLSRPNWGYQRIQQALDQLLVFLSAAVLVAATLSMTTGIKCSTVIALFPLHLPVFNCMHSKGKAWEALLCESCKLDGQRGERSPTK